MENLKNRCSWCGTDELYVKYHDEEWGIPVHDDRLLFEQLILEGAQAGLSWITVLRKRENYRTAFDNFDIAKIALYDEVKIQDLLQNPGIVRNKLKVRGTIINAQLSLKIQEEFGSLDKYLWQFTDYQTITSHPQKLSDLNPRTPESDKMSKDLQKRGFKFVGSTICYAFMQAVGMVDDHLVDCWRKQ